MALQAPAGDTMPAEGWGLILLIVLIWFWSGDVQEFGRKALQTLSSSAEKPSHLA